MSSLDEILEKEKDRRRKRAAKFGTEFDENAEVAIPLDDAKEQLRSSPAEPRRDADTADGADLVRDVALHVHGVRFHSSAEVVGLFKGHGVASIEWVTNDSCNVIFDSSFESKRALLALGTLEGDEEMTADGEELPRATKADSGALPWYRAKFAPAEGGQITFRQATISDRKKLLTEIMRCVGKTDGPAADILRSALASDSRGGSKRARAESDGAGSVSSLRMGFSRDLDAPNAGPDGVDSALPVMAPPMVPPMVMAPWPPAQPVALAAEDTQETGDLRDKLRKSDGDLRDKLRQKGIERVEEDEEGREDLRAVIDQQRRERRKDSIRHRLQSKVSQKEPNGGGGRIFVQSVSSLQEKGN